MRYYEIYLTEDDERLEAIKVRRAEIDLRAAEMRLRKEKIEARVAAELSGAPTPQEIVAANETERERRERIARNRPINRLVAQMMAYDADPSLGWAGRERKEDPPAKD